MDWTVGDGSDMSRLSGRRVRGRGGGLGVAWKRDGGWSRRTRTGRVGALKRGTTFILKKGQKSQSTHK